MAYGVLLATCLVVWLAFWPGLISPDGNQTIYQAATDIITDWWTAFGAWLLHWWDRLELGIGAVYGISVVAVVVGGYLCARFAFRRVPAALVTLLVCLNPPTYAELGTLSRDTFYLGFTLLGFGLFGRLVQSDGLSKRTEYCVVAAAIGCELFAFLCRQNGITCVFALLLGLGLWGRSRRSPPPARLTRREVLAASSGALLATAAIGFVTFPIYSLAGVRAVHAERFLYVYDLAGISVLSHHDRFPTRIVRGSHPGWVSPPDTGQGTLDRLFDPVNVIALYPNNAAGNINFVDTEIAGREARLLKTAWWQAVRAEPLDYLWGRVRLFAVQLGLWRHPTDAYLPLLNPRNFGYPLAFYSGYRAASDVIARFVGPSPWIPLDFPWTWLILMIVVVVVLMRRLAHKEWFVTLLPIAVLLNYGVLFFVAVAAGFRYVSLEIPVTMLVLAYFVATIATKHDRWRGLVEPSYAVLVQESRA